MELSKKLLFIFSALSLGIFSSAHADQDYLKYASQPANITIPDNIDSSINRGFSWDWNASGSLDSNVGQLQGFDNLGDKIQVRNLGISADFLYSIFGARVSLKDNYESSLKVDASNLQEKVKDLYVGIQPLTNTVVLFGRMDIPFGDNITERAIDINDPIRRLNIDNERYVVGTVQVTPQFMQELLSVKTQIQVSAFNEQKDPNLRINDAGHLGSYSARLKMDFAKLFQEVQVSYMHKNDGSHQADVSVHGYAVGPLTPYAEVRMIRKDAIYGDTTVGTAGVAMAVWGGKAYLEGSRVKTRNSNFLANKTQNNATLGYSHPLNKWVDGSLEGTTNVADKKDKTVMATVTVHREDRSSDNTSLFSTIAAKKAAASQQ